MTKQRGGRTSKYYTHVEPKLLLIEAWARDGLIDEDIAKKLGIGVSTLHSYKHDHPELVESLKKGKEVADVEVENALFKRALGYKYDEVTKETVKDIDPDTGGIIMRMVETKRVTKEVQPDVTAQIFWLKNRKPEAWRDKQDIEHSGRMGHDVHVEGMKDDELHEGIATTLQAIADLQARIGAPPKT